MSTVYGYCDLSDLEWLGDDPVKMQEFFDPWDRILDNLEEAEHISEKTERDLFDRQVAKSKMLESDGAWFRRHPNTDDHTYEFSRNSVERCIENDRNEKNMTSPRNALKQKSSPPELQPGARSQS
jgi:hypothetical protein